MKNTGVGSYIAPFCKACIHWTVIDILGGDYCTKLKKCVASPQPEYRDKDCPLLTKEETK